MSDIVKRLKKGPFTAAAIRIETIAYIIALEARITAADRLDAMAEIAQERLDLAGHDDIRDHLSAARANYHATKKATQ